MSVATVNTIAMDLNGTGVLVDVSAWLDQPEGISATWGRADWTSAEPSPGTLLFALNNFDGRFTPGQTAFYTVGCQKGVLVEWTCNTRKLRYRIDSLAIQFPTQAGGQSIVAVVCSDALALLASQQCPSEYWQTVMLAKPAATYVFDDTFHSVGVAPGLKEGSGSGFPPFLVQTSDGQDQTGLDGAIGHTTPMSYAYAGGTGAPADGLPNMATLPAAQGPVDCALNNVGLEVQIAQDDATRALWSDPVTTKPRDYGFSFSFWWSVNDIYLGKDAAASHYVWLAGWSQPQPISLLWRAETQTLYLLQWVPATGKNTLTAIGPACAPNVSHRTLVRFQVTDTAASLTFSVSICTDNTRICSSLTATALYNDPDYPWPSQPGPTAIRFAGCAGAPNITVNNTRLGYPGAKGMTQTGATNDPILSLSGSIGPVEIWGRAPDLPWNAVLAPAGLSYQPYQAGMWGISGETAAARFLQLGTWTTHPEIGFQVVGAARPDILAVQTTAGRSMLTVIAEAVRGERAAVKAGMVGAVETVTAYTAAAQQQLVPVAVFDAEADLADSPQMAFDLSGLAVTATATSPTGVAVYVDPTAPARLADATADVACLLSQPGDLLNVAQDRTVQGRTGRVALSSISVDTRTAQNDLLAALLALTPGQTIAVTNLPPVLGYQTTSGYVIGGDESHTVDSDVFTLAVQAAADTFDAVVDPTDGTLDLSVVRRDDPVAAGTIAVAGTTITLTNPDDSYGADAYFTTDPGDYPLPVTLVQAASPFATVMATVISATAPAGTVQTLTLAASAGTFTAATLALTAHYDAVAAY